MTDRDALIARLRAIGQDMGVVTSVLMRTARDGNDDQKSIERLNAWRGEILAVMDVLSTPPPAPTLKEAAECPTDCPGCMDCDPVGSHRPGKIVAAHPRRVESLVAATPPPVPTDVERMIRECVPGGQSCDPQQVADALRSWFEGAATPPPAPTESDDYQRGKRDAVRALANATKKRLTDDSMASLVAALTAADAWTPLHANPSSAATPPPADLVALVREWQEAESARPMNGEIAARAGRAHAALMAYPLPAPDKERPMTPQEAIDCIKHNWPGDSNAFGRLREALGQAIAALKLAELPDYNLEWAKRLAAETAPLQAGGRHAGKVGTLGEDLAVAAVQELIRRLDAELPPLPCGCSAANTACRAGSLEECRKLQEILKGPDIEAGDWVRTESGHMFVKQGEDCNSVSTSIAEVRKRTGEVWTRHGAWWKKEGPTK